MKKIIKRILNKMGIDVIRYNPQVNRTSKKTKRLSYHSTPTGNYYLPTDAVDDIVANTIISGQVFEKEVVELAYKYIQPDTIVLDIGANFGQMSVLFADKVGSTGKVYSFDADDWVYEIFCKNIKANNKEDKIVPHFGAIHNKAGETLIFPEQNFEEYGAYGAYGIDYNAKEGRSVNTITIDSLNIERPISFIKIDIQGGDLQAMQGAVETIKRNQCPILFEYEYHFEEKYKLSFQEYVDFVRSINYRFHRVINGHNFLIIPENYLIGSERK